MSFFSFTPRYSSWNNFRNCFRNCSMPGEQDIFLWISPGIGRRSASEVSLGVFFLKKFLHLRIFFRNFLFLFLFFLEISCFCNFWKNFICLYFDETAGLFCRKKILKGTLGGFLRRIYVGISVGFKNQILKNLINFMK